jgi:hypothetical protein
MRTLKREVIVLDFSNGQTSLIKMNLKEAFNL